MRIINKDLTKETVRVYITNSQIYIKIFTKIHGKWEHEEYFRSFDFEIDEELVNSTLQYIIRLWGLNNPKVTVIK